MFWKGATKIGMLTSVIGSLIMAVIWNFVDRPFGLHEIIPGLAVSLILLVVVSLLTKHPSEEDVKSYFFAMKKVEEPSEEQVI